MHPDYLALQPVETAALAIKEATRVKQAENYDDYLKSIEAVTKHLREVESKDMSDALRDQIRQWFLECRLVSCCDTLAGVSTLNKSIKYFRCLLSLVCFANSYANGAFPDFPSEEVGGSSLIFSDKDPQQVKHYLI